ncbi:MAG: TetR/AcrR family transcriptional regulator [Crocinitomicaceae bacterium TMED114]|nr:MAG: TetR/AcrR family transcriptional regulator [Crocinitomicaceae bacterium TMED114]
MTDAASGLLTAATLDRFTAKTRDRILEASLVLFNERGFGAVTTASIAEQAGVLEGSLWYHFRTKKDLLTAHIALLQQVFEGANLDADSTDAETIIAGIFSSYDVIWDFRYILRDDFSAVLDADEPAIQTARLINDFLDSWTEGRICHASENGLLEMDTEEMENLSEIILVIGRYWLDFSGKKYPETDNLALRHRGLRHIFTVLDPYLLPEAKPLIATRLVES